MINCTSCNTQLFLQEASTIQGFYSNKVNFAVQEHTAALIIMKNHWKFESNQKITSKTTSHPASPNPNSSPNPNPHSKNDLFPPPNKIQIGSSQAEQKSPLKRTRGKGVAIKMKAKVQEQLRGVYRQLQQREEQLGGLSVEAEGLVQALRERRRMCEDLLNNEQMLQFKERQLSNLMTIHAELLEGAKKDILNEKSVKFSYDEKIVSLKKRIAEFNSRAIERSHLKDAIQLYTQEKARLEEQLKGKKQTEAKRKQLRSEAIRQLLQQLVRRNRRELEEQCQKKARIIHETSSKLKHHDQLRQMLATKGLPPSEYYTFGQLKHVQELSFRTNPEAEKMMRIFYRDVNPKIPEIIERFEEPEEFIKLKGELANLVKAKREKEEERKKKESDLARLEEEKSKLKKAIGELKAKTDMK